jgi:3',5'-cyclic AMP phosphodiesterase CpdA
MSRRGFVKAAALTGAAACSTSIASTAVTVREALRLVFFADVHARSGRRIPQLLARAARAVNHQCPELVIAGGDLISEGFESEPVTAARHWQTYLQMHQAIEAPVEPVLGNHDLVAARPVRGQPSPDPRQVFRHHFGLSSTFRSFDANGYHIILLDTIEVSSAGEPPYTGRVDGEQLRWLEADLARIDSGQPIIIVSHMPLMTAFYQATAGATTAALVDRVVVNSRQVLQLFEGHNLVLVLQGHLHVNELLRWQSTTFITGGALCGGWWSGPWHGTEAGFGVVTLRRHQVDWEYRRW